MYQTILDDNPFGYPALIAGEGDCPPKDVGILVGYCEFLRIFNLPKRQLTMASLRLDLVIGLKASELTIAESVALNLVGKCGNYNI